MCFPKVEGILSFSVLSVILADLLGNTWLLIRDWWILISFVCFVFQGSLLWDRPVLGNNRLVKFALQIFLIFRILVTCNNRATFAYFL